MKLGIDLFSIRSQGWTPIQYLDYCAKQGARVVHFSEVRFIGSLDTFTPPKDVPVHVVYAGQRVLPARVGAFIDFAADYLASEGMERPYQGGHEARLVR